MSDESGWDPADYLKAIDNSGATPVDGAEMASRLAGGVKTAPMFPEGIQNDWPPGTSITGALIKALPTPLAALTPGFNVVSGLTTSSEPEKPAPKGFNPQNKI